MTKKVHIWQRFIIIGLIIILVIYAIGGWVLSSWLYAQAFGRDDTNTSQLFITDYLYQDVDQQKYPRSEFTFTSDNNLLLGFEYGIENTRGVVVIVAGVSGNGDDYMNFVTRFVDDEYCVITFDKTGMARSEGEGLRGTYQSALDVDALLSYIEAQSRFDKIPIYLLGHSWGGYGVCAALVKPHRVNAVVSIAGYNSGIDMVADQGVKLAGFGYYLLHPFFFAIQKLTFGTAMNFTAIDGINASNIPFLIIQGKNDEAITVDGLSIYANRSAITNNKTTYLLTEGDHERPYASVESREYQLEFIENWQQFAQRPEVAAELNSGEVERINAIKKSFALEFSLNKQLLNAIDEDIIQKIETMFDVAK